MAFYKAPKPEITSVSLHGHEYEVVNGFIEVPDAVYGQGDDAQVDVAGRIDETLRQQLGWKLSSADEIGAAVAENDAADAAARDLSEREALLAQIRAAGLNVDARRATKWLRERHAEFVEQGLIKVGGMPEDQTRSALAPQNESAPTGPAPEASADAIPTQDPSPPADLAAEPAAPVA